MALPAYLHRFLSAEALPAANRVSEAFSGSEVSEVIQLGLPGLDEALPGSGLPRGTVVELSVCAGAQGTTVALAACRAAQREGMVQSGQPSWCAFVDPTATLHSPGVAQSGVMLERLLVARPPAEALGRTVVRLAESRAFAVLVVDTRGVPGASLHTSLGKFARVVRRLALAVEGSGAIVLLITDATASRPLPLPVGMRLELRRAGIHELEVRVAKDRRGRISAPRTIAWVRPKPEALQYGRTG